VIGKMSGGQHRDDKSEQAESIGWTWVRLTAGCGESLADLEGASALMHGCVRRKKKTNEEFLDTAGVVRDFVDLMRLVWPHDLILAKHRRQAGVYLHPTDGQKKLIPDTKPKNMNEEGTYQIHPRKGKES
jgi:hypothetical protein